MAYKPRTLGVIDVDALIGNLKSLLASTEFDRNNKALVICCDAGGRLVELQEELPVPRGWFSITNQLGASADSSAESTVSTEKDLMTWLRAEGMLNAVLRRVITCLQLSLTAPDSPVEQDYAALKLVLDQQYHRVGGFHERLTEHQRLVASKVEELRDLLEQQ